MNKSGSPVSANFSSWLALFASSSTLICCALPSLLVVLGMGATMAGLVSAIPQLIWISQYKGYVFGFSGLMIVLSFFFQYRAINAPCPTDPELAMSCSSSRRWSWIVLSISSLIWLIGAFFAFVAGRF